ncbi:MAG: polysaccharide biosynthesis protein [Clostridium sp.]
MEKRQTRQKKETNFVVQGSILAVAGIVVRLIGILYRVPMTNIIGDEGMGYYTTAFNVYNIILILSSYSLPLAVSKMVAASIAKEQYRNSVKILKAALVYATIVGGAACFITWHFGSFFAGTVFNTPFAIYALKTLAPTMWIMAYLGVLRGYFQGHGTMVPTAVSQIFEQIVNAIISVTAAGVLFKIGLDSNKVYQTTGYPEAFGAAGGTIGTGAGALAAFLFVLILFMIYRPTMRRQMRRDRSGVHTSYQQISLTFFFTVLPVIISSTVYNISSVVDNSIMAYGMEALGRGKEFLSLWGIYNNKYMLLVHVPLAMANSLSSSLIPSLSGAVARKEEQSVIAKTGLAIRFAMLIAIPAAVGLTVLAAPINNLLFHNGSNAQAIKMMLVGSSAVVFLSLSTVTNAILQGINHMNIPIRNAAISLVLHVMALYVMLMVLKMGIYSVLFSNILFAVFMCLLNGFAIKKYLHYKQEIVKTFLLPTLAAAFMGAAAFITYKGIHLLTHSNIIGTIMALLIAVAVYGTLLIKLRCVEEKELYTMPGGTKIIKIARQMRLL